MPVVQHKKAVKKRFIAQKIQRHPQSTEWIALLRIRYSHFFRKIRAHGTPEHCLASSDAIDDTLHRTLPEILFCFHYRGDS